MDEHDGWIVQTLVVAGIGGDHMKLWNNIDEGEKSLITVNHHYNRLTGGDKVSIIAVHYNRVKGYSLKYTIGHMANTRNKNRSAQYD
jgi:hypothetical protein